MSFLGGIFDFSFLFSIFYLVGGSRRPVSYTEIFLLFNFNFLILWDVLRGRDF